MNQTRILLSVHTVTVLFALTIVQPAVHAASLTWDANGTTAGQTDGGGGWLNANLWWTGSANQTWSSGSDAVFGNGGAGGTVSLASPTTVNSLTMNSFSGTYTLGSAGQTITLASGLTRNSGAGAVAISSPVTLGGAQTWLNNSANTLTISGAVDNGGNLLTIDGSGPTSFGAVTLSGAGGLTKNGTGNLNLNGPTVSISGSLVINGGEVLEYNMGIGTGNLTLNGGILEDYWGGNLTRTLGSGAGQVQVPGGVSGFSGQGTTGLTLKINNNAAYEVVWGAASEAGNTNATGFFNPSTLVLQGPWANAGGNVNFQNKVDLNGTTRTIAVNKDPGTTTGNATISGAIRTSSGTAGLIKTGPGVMILSGANTYNGATTVNQGTMRFNSIGAIGGSGRNVIGTNGVTVAAGYAMDNTFLSRLAENTNFFTVALGAASSANLDFNTSAGATLPNASLGAVGAYTYSGTLTPNGTTYRLGGGGGTLTVSSALTAAGNSLVVGGAIQLNAANNFSGDTLVQSGTLSVNTNLALQNSAIDTSGSGVIAILSAATTPTIGGLKGSKNITALITTGYGSVTNLTLNPGAGVTNSYSGVIANGAPGMALTKSGSGTQILSGANTYSGNTTVSGGTLALSQPTLSTNSTVTVASDAVLRLDFAGTNTVSGLVLNGVSQASGVYNSTTAAPYLTGTGTLRVVLYDTDGDGIPDTWMMKYFGHLTGLAADKSRAQDDADSDGLTNLQEYQLGTNPVLADTDGDGISDGDEVNIYHTNPLLADTDGDGLSDYEELFVYHTDPLKWDTDGDGLSDGDEVKIYHTNPLVADTDGDGVGDWYEVMATYTSPTNAADKPNIPYPLPRPGGSKGATNKPVKVFILSGQSNMVGEGDVNPLGTPGTLSTIVKQQNRFPELLNTNGNWSVWSNVMYRGVITALGNGPLTIGQGASSVQFGPELGFGRVMGYCLDEPVLLIKASQGNRGLFWDILPPGSPPYTNGTTVYAGYGQSPNSWPTTNGPSPFIWYAGKQYDDFFLAVTNMGLSDWVAGTDYQASGNLGSQVLHKGVAYICTAPHTATSDSEPAGGAHWTAYWSVYTVENVTTVLDNFATQYPQWAAQGFEIAGYVWFQGNWDIQNGALSANRYQTNLVNLIKTLRQYYANRYPGKCSTNTPFVLATGCGDPGTSGNGLIVANAQLAVSGERGNYPEFAGNVKTMDTRGYWRALAQSPNPQGYHYYHNAETYMLTGDALGRGMVGMLSTGTSGDYSSWAAQWPGANLSDPNADFDGDGLSNDYERIWGLNPTNAASRNAFASTTGLAAGTFSYTRRAVALSGLSYTVWTSTNLTTWTQDTGAVQTASAQVNGVETVTVNLSPALLGGPRLYVRMRAQ